MVRNRDFIDEVVRRTPDGVRDKITELLTAFKVQNRIFLYDLVRGVDINRQLLLSVSFSEEQLHELADKPEYIQQVASDLPLSSVVVMMLEDLIDGAEKFKAVMEMHTTWEEKVKVVTGDTEED